MRARLAMYTSGVVVELREVVLRDKPAELVELSQKATVPVLVCDEGRVIDESLDIMLWALNRNDPEGWLPEDTTLQQEAFNLIAHNDGSFKASLDRYKYADRFPEQPASDYRQQAEMYIGQLELRLQSNAYLMSDKPNLADMAIFPFIRQFAHVDKPWFDQAPYPGVQRWLKALMDSSLFADIMTKYSQWRAGNELVLFGNGLD